MFKKITISPYKGQFILRGNKISPYENNDILWYMEIYIQFLWYLHTVYI